MQHAPLRELCLLFVGNPERVRSIPLASKALKCSFFDSMENGEERFAGRYFCRPNSARVLCQSSHKLAALELVITRRVRLAGGKVLHRSRITTR